jgi:hypothetical protein
MTVIIGEDSDSQELLEQTHDELATENGRGNVLVFEAGSEVVTLVGEGVGDIDPINIDTRTTNNES